jgi:hypothetical protein
LFGGSDGGLVASPDRLINFKNANFRISRFCLDHPAHVAVELNM